MHVKATNLQSAIYERHTIRLHVICHDLYTARKKTWLNEGRSQQPVWWYTVHYITLTVLTLQLVVSSIWSSTACLCFCIHSFELVIVLKLLFFVFTDRASSSNIQKQKHVVHFKLSYIQPLKYKRKKLVRVTREVFPSCPTSQICRSSC